LRPDSIESPGAQACSGNGGAGASGLRSECRRHIVNALTLAKGPGTFAVFAAIRRLLGISEVRLVGGRDMHVLVGEELSIILVLHVFAHALPAPETPAAPQGVIVFNAAEGEKVGSSGADPRKGTGTAGSGPGELRRCGNEQRLVRRTAALHEPDTPMIRSAF
jgi:hypothetical protein